MPKRPNFIFTIPSGAGRIAGCYKNDPSGTLEYGLVADEVQRVYPNLVTYGTDGKLQSVRLPGVYRLFAQ
jgi:hypothetical protein